MELLTLERSFVIRCMSGHLFFDRQCAVVYHQVCLWCVVLADIYSAEEVVCVSVVVLVRVATLVGSQVGHQLVLL